jgi:hypothetical protein
LFCQLELFSELFFKQIITSTDLAAVILNNLKITLEIRLQHIQMQNSLELYSLLGIES